MLPMPNPKALFFPPSAAVPETEPTEPGPLGKCGSHLSPANTPHLCIPPMFSAFLFGGRERCNAEHNLRAHGFFPPIRTCLHFWGGQTTRTSPDSHCRLPGGAVPLHQALLRPQALQAVPERDLLLQASAGAAPFPPTPIPIGTAPHLGCLFFFLTPKIHLFPAASAGST